MLPYPPPKFGINDVVRVKAGVSLWHELPGNKATGVRVGDRAVVFGVSDGRLPHHLVKFPPGILYGIEYDDGHSIELHEDDLELVEKAVPDDFS
jgi:hypothetical protein